MVGAGGRAATAHPRTSDRLVTGWIDRTAHPLASLDPVASLGDLGALRTIAGRATVVGLGESTHGSREQFRVKHRIARFLVERLGFRTIGLEHDFAQGTLIDRYVTTGEGDPRALVQDMSFPFWICQEMLDLVRWMRAYNQTHRDKVRFLGTDIIALRDLSFDTVIGYVRQAAPDRVTELQTLLSPLRPTGPGHTYWYQYQLTPGERRSLIEAARLAYQLVRAVPATAPPLEREYAQQHARAIVGWYESFNNPDFAPERGVFIADTIGWWQRTIGGSLVYWAADAHVTSAHEVTYRYPGGGWTGRTAGSFLKERLGRRYVAVGSLFGHGSISSNWEALGPYPIDAPPAGLLDATLGTAHAANYLLDLDAPAPGPVRAWLAGPAVMRMILPSYKQGEEGSDYVMSVDSLADAFDALVYVRRTTATRLL
jgi:erythromycin esterase